MTYCKRWGSALCAVLALVAVVVTANAQVALFEDNFDSYAAGVYPTSSWWNMFSGVVATVSSERSVSPPHSFRIESLPTWARWDCVTLTVPDWIGYRASVYLSDSGRGGAVGFGFVEPGAPGTGRFANAVFFANDGNVYFSTRTAGNMLVGTWTPGLWNTVVVDLNYVAMTADLVINGVAVVDVPIDPKVLPASVYGTEVPLDQFGVFGENFSGTGSSVLFFDNIAVIDNTAVPVERTTWGHVKSLFDE